MRSGKVTALKIDNHHTERSIRGVAVGRNNWIFFGSDQGGHTLALLRSFVASSQRVGVDPYAWFKDVLSRIAAHPITRLAELLPHTAPAVTTDDLFSPGKAGVGFLDVSVLWIGVPRLMPYAPWTTIGSASTGLLTPPPNCLLQRESAFLGGLTRLESHRSRTRAHIRTRTYARALWRQTGTNPANPAKKSVANLSSLDPVAKRIEGVLPGRRQAP
jgi:hypothetical protein